MTTPGSRPPRKGFLANLQSAMAPVVPEDDGSPIVRPTVIKIATGLVLLGAIAFLFTGFVSLTTASQQASQGRTLWSDAVKQCESAFGTYGSAIPSTVATPSVAPSGPITADQLPEICRVNVTTPELSQADEDSIRSSAVTFGVIFTIVGLAIGIAGWYLRSGVRWARRVLVTIAILALGAAALLRISSSLTLLGTLFLVVGLVLTYVGKGGVFYLRSVQRRSRSRP